MPQGLLQKLMLALGLWGLGTFLWQYPVGRLVIYGSVVFAALFGVVLYLHKHDQPRLARFYQVPACKAFIDLVCRWTKKQPPVDPARQPKSVQAASPGGDLAIHEGEKARVADELLVSEPQHFRELIDHLYQHVCGHEEAILAAVRSLERNITLRKNSLEDAKLPPLGIFLFAGAPGVGKRHLATLLARAVYKSRHVLQLNLREYADEAGTAELFGSTQPEKPGQLIEEVMRHPFHCVILDHVERAAPGILERLTGIFRDGSWQKVSSGPRVSFKHCVFFLLTSAGYESIGKSAMVETTDASRTRISEILARECLLPVSFLASIQDMAALPLLDDLDRARVVVRLMERECRKYELSLDYVDPEILADEVMAILPQDGFEALPARIARVMRKPLARAMDQKKRGVVVRPLRPSPRTQ